MTYPVPSTTWTFNRADLRNQLRVVTAGDTLNWPAVKAAVVGVVANAGEARLLEHARLFLSDEFGEIMWEAEELLNSLPDNSIFGYLRTPLADGTTEWAFSTTHGVGDNECGQLMDAIGAVIAWPEVAAAAGIVSIVVR